MEAQVEVGVEIVDVRRVSQFRCPVKKAGISFRPNLVGIFDERQVKWSSRSEPLRITSITRSNPLLPLFDDLLVLPPVTPNKNAPDYPLLRY